MLVNYFEQFVKVSFMKTMITGFCFSICPLVSANTFYFTATGDDDTSDGPISNPWVDPEYACQQLSAGDTLFIRGEIYYGIENDISGWGAPDPYFLYIDGYDVRWNNGTLFDPTVVMSYPNERVIFGITNITSTWSVSSNVMQQSVTIGILLILNQLMQLLMKH